MKQYNFSFEIAIYIQINIFYFYPKCFPKKVFFVEFFGDNTKYTFKISLQW